MLKRSVCRNTTEPLKNGVCSSQCKFSFIMLIGTVYEMLCLFCNVVPHPEPAHGKGVLEI